MKFIKENSFAKIPRQERHKFYESQFNYYRNFNTSIVIIGVLGSLTYFISDCQLFGGFETKTIIPRFSILIELALFLWIRSKQLDFKIEMVASQIVGHSIMWHTIWTITYLPDRQYVDVGFTIMQIGILLLGFASSFEVAVVSQLMIVINILVSNMFIHYEDIDLLISLELPCTIGISMAHYVFTQSYYESYVVSNKLEDLSCIDQLTGVYNRHKLNEITEKDKLKSYRLQDITFIILDIDFFKIVNDTYGHDKGDIILKNLAVAIKNNVPDNGLIIRWGGEEFLIILYGCDEKDAYQIAEKIRREVENQDNGISKITVSLGICEYDYNSYKATVNKADKALYRAKELGRNRTVKYSSIS